MPYRDPASDAAREANRRAQRAWRERLKLDAEAFEEFKRKERRRSRITYATDAVYADRRRNLAKEKYANDPEIRAAMAARNATPDAKQRRRALKCISTGSAKHLPDQVKILTDRARRLLKEIDET